jgi:hypothetical protein
MRRIMFPRGYLCLPDVVLHSFRSAPLNPSLVLLGGQASGEGPNRFIASGSLGGPRERGAGAAFDKNVIAQRAELE